MENKQTDFVIKMRYIMKRYTFKDLIKKAENYGIIERGKNIYTRERLAELISDREIHKNPNIKLLAILEKIKKNLYIPVD